MNTEPRAPKKPYEIVVGFDFSDLAERALEEAFDMARHRAPAEISVVTVAQPAGLLLRLPGDKEAMVEDLARETVRLRIAAIVDEYQARRGPVVVDRIGVYVLTGLPAGEQAKAIVDLATAVAADLIVVGTHGRTGVRRLLLGSVAALVVRDATTNVHVVRPSDFVRGEKVPEIEPPLTPGQPHLKHFEHRRTYHYIDKVAPWTHRTMPAS